MHAAADLASAPADARPPAVSGPLRVALLACLLVAGVFLAHANGLRGAWVFDDHAYILRNRQLRHLWPPAYLRGNTRPVLFLTLALNRAINGEAPFGYHLVNLLVHLGAALALFGLLRRILRLPALGPAFAARSDDLACVCALLWGAHPLGTMAVTYIWQRGESLASFMYLLVLWAVVRAAGAPRPRLWHALAVGACFLGMGTKEIMVSCPLAALLLDRVLLAGSWRELWRRRRALHLLLASSWLFFGLLAAGSAAGFHENVGVGFHSMIYTPWEYACTMPGVILHYLRLVFWPRPLCIDYAWPVTEKFAAALPPALPVAAMLILTAWGLWRRRPWSVPVAICFLVLAPTSSVMPMPDPAVEYRMYLPLAGVLVLLVTGVFALAVRCGERLAGPGCAWALALAMALGLGALTHRRNRDYASPLRLWNQTVLARPRNPRAWLNLGVALLHARDFADAEFAFRQSLRLQAGLQRHALELARRRGKRVVFNNAEGHYLLGLSLYLQERPGPALACMQRAISLQPAHARAHYVLALLLRRQGHAGAASREAAIARRLDPGLERSRNLPAGDGRKK